MFNARKRSKLLIISTVLSVVAIIAAVFGIFAPSVSKDTEAIGRFDWSIGTINAEGKPVESTRSIYTKDMIEVNKMNIDVSDENAIITYKLVFYDENKEFISVTEAFTNDFEEDAIPETASYFRVIVTPTMVDDEPVKISFINMAKYINLIDVTYAK